VEKKSRNRTASFDEALFIFTTDPLNYLTAPAFPFPVPASGGSICLLVARGGHDCVPFAQAMFA
jgi:hypothetical protein